ncbi:hypothetical protein ACL6C3_28680 [Capilliphycus salinus ALCB114379]|uniref:hypothetical protein n=1 Tax=Capilliphycus salinus TaxID=2768948 RepID=UPI0039A77C15
MKSKKFVGLMSSSLLLVGCLGSVLALPAIAGIINLGTPLHRGTEIDGTPWEWDGIN